MLKKITTASTKKEILEAYNELLQQKQQQKEVPAKDMEAEKKIETVESASMQAPDKVMKDIAGLKIELSQSLDKIEEKLIEEYKNLSKLQEAISIEKENLKNFYGIKAEADTLSALLEAQHEKKENFEKEINQQIEEWVREKENTDKERQREEEEYNYRIKREREKEEDEYNEKKSKLERELKERKQAFEKEIQERENELKQKEEEHQRLKEASENFPVELKAAVEEAEKRVTEKLREQFNFEKKMFEKDFKAELMFKEQNIKTLDGRINEMYDNLKAMQKKVESADTNVKEIVLKAIESSSARFAKAEEKIRNERKEQE